MKVDCQLLDAIGNTPLIRLRRASERSGCTIIGKAEFMNPGGSVNDRAALARQPGPGRVIKAVSCDSALRFELTLFNPGFLHSNGLPVTAWRERSPGHFPAGALAG